MTRRENLWIGQLKEIHDAFFCKDVSFVFQFQFQFQMDLAFRASSEWKETCAQTGYQLGLTLLIAARDSITFSAPPLRSLLEVRCFRGPAPDEWQIFVVPFAHEIISVEMSDMDCKSRLALLALVLRRKRDGFSRMETSNFGNEVCLRDFVYDARLTRFLENENENKNEIEKKREKSVSLRKE